MMQKCLNCQEKLKYSQVFRTVINGYKPLECERCGEKHKVTFSSRLRVTLIVIVLPLLLGILFFEEISGLERVIFLITLVVFMLLGSPVLMRFSRLR